MFPTDEEIMFALCCGGTCENDDVCHRLDFANEAKRIRALLERWDFADEAKRVRVAGELMQ